MKLRSYLATGVILLAALADAQDAATLPNQITLNGVTRILGDRLACFKATFPGNPAPVSFMLAEGQGRYGIRLVAVDFQKSTVTIRNQDGTQTIPICSAPNLALTESAAGVTGANASIRNRGFGAAAFAGGSQNTPAGQSFGTDGIAFAAGGARHGSSSSGDAGSGGSAEAGAGNDADSSDNSGNQAVSNQAAPPGTHVYQYWLTGAQQIEQARIATADRVLIGEWPAYPLTPLTPANTAPLLIGSNSVFMDHGPGLIVADN